MLNKKVAVIYLYYNEPDSCLENAAIALHALDYPQGELTFVVVNNPHPEHGLSLDKLKKHFDDLPFEVKYLPQEKNLGYAGGNNAAMKWALENGFEYIVLHNGDGFLDSRSISVMTEVMEKNSNVGLCQPLIVLHPENRLINTDGNVYHYLGFGYAGDYRKKISDLPDFKVRDIGYASGACFMVRTDLVKAYGFLDEDYFLYHEDLEYSFRLKFAGYRSVIAPLAKFYHQYDFCRDKKKMYYMERNRYAFLFTYFKWPTLLLIFPMAVAVDAGMFFFAIKNRWAKQKIKACLYWLNPGSWKKWLKKRNARQKQRVRTDKYILNEAVGKMVFDDKMMDSFWLKKIGNPIMEGYFKVVRKFICW